MNWDRVEGNWTEFKGQVQQKWGKLTNDDLDVIEGKRKELAGRLQQRYGYAKDQAETEIDGWLKKVVITAHHPCGTCAIGPDAVLDSDLKVRGIEGLRVCDAAAMPDLVSAHINACVLMMAEKGADLIRGKPPLPQAEAA